MKRSRRLTSLLLLALLVISSSITSFANPNTITLENGETITLFSTTEGKANYSQEVKLNFVVNGKLETHIIEKYNDGSSRIEIERKNGKNDFISINANGYARSSDPLFNNTKVFTDAKIDKQDFMLSYASARASSNWNFLYSESRDLDLSNILESVVKGGVTSALVTKGVSVLVAATSFVLTPLGSAVVSLMAAFLGGAVAYYTSGSYSSVKLNAYEFKPDTNINRAEMKMYYKGTFICDESATWAVDIYD